MQLSRRADSRPPLSSPYRHRRVNAARRASVILGETTGKEGSRHATSRVHQRHLQKERLRPHRAANREMDAHRDIRRLNRRLRVVRGAQLRPLRLKTAPKAPWARAHARAGSAALQMRRPLETTRAKQKRPRARYNRNRQLPFRKRCAILRRAFHFARPICQACAHARRIFGEVLTMPCSFRTHGAQAHTPAAFETASLLLHTLLSHVAPNKGASMRAFARGPVQRRPHWHCL